MFKLTFYKKRWLMLLYFPLYLFCFFLIEQKQTAHFHIIHTMVDNYIPFCEFFVIPYFLWFAYIGFAFAFFIFAKDSSDYYKLCTNIYLGMTIFIIVSFLYPNAQQLRPSTFVRDNIFVTLTKFLYHIDTPTNLFPSIHVFNALGIHIAIIKSVRFSNKKYRPLKIASLILMIAIILATMFLKQHSFFDVATGILMQMIFYPFIYGKYSNRLSEKVASFA